MAESPGGPLASRPLHFFWLADCSGSMAADGKIQALNNAIRETIPHLRDVAADNPFAQMYVRSLAFSTGFRWHIEQPTRVEDLVWTDLEAGGFTDLGTALHELARQLRVPPMPERALPPAIVLISDGQPTDDWETALDLLLREPWGQRSIRIGVAIGRDADLDVLDRFIGREDVKPVTANNPEQLAQLIRWASTVASRVASIPAVPIPQAPVLSDPIDATW
jgi:uncharacterized protein YegL